MKTSMIKYAGAIGLAGALAVMAATSSFAQTRTGEDGGKGYPFPYCVPQDESAALRQSPFCSGQSERVGFARPELAITRSD
jgi:hypothetical protein